MQTVLCQERWCHLWSWDTKLKQHGKSFPCQFINKQVVLIPHVPKWWAESDQQNYKSVLWAFLVRSDVTDINWEQKLNCLPPALGSPEPCEMSRMKAPFFPSMRKWIMRLSQGTDYRFYNLSRTTEHGLSLPHGCMLLWGEWYAGPINNSSCMLNFMCTALKNYFLLSS